MPQTNKISPKKFYGFDLDKKGNFNGKPPAHWLREADEAMMSAIISQIMPGRNSMIATIVSERLSSLARALDPELFQKLSDERDNARRNLSAVVASILGRCGERDLYCSKHLPSKRTLKHASTAKRKARR